MKHIKDNALENIFRTLRYKNYRLFFAGQGVSLVGTWIQQVAMSWLVYRMTDSAFMLGLVGYCTLVPTFILSPFSGVMADRWNKHRVLIVTQTLSMLQAILLAILTLTGNIAVWHIIVLAVFLGCINSLDIPARQSFVIDMVERKENLGNAIALNSLMFNGARLIGPSIAGLLIAVTGEGICFLINGISYLAVIAALLCMDVKTHERKETALRILDELKEGVRYTFGFMPTRFILMLLAVVSAIGMSYSVLMPVFAKDVLKGGPSTLGFLTASAGIGAVVATVYLASKKTVIGLMRFIPASAAIFAASLVVFALSRAFWFSAVMLVFIGFAFMTNTASANTILQTITDDDKRGRVMSFYTMSFMGMAPLGSILTGIMASRIGATWTLIIGGCCCMAAAMAFAVKLPVIREKIRPLYKKIGVTVESPRV